MLLAKKLGVEVGALFPPINTVKFAEPKGGRESTFRDRVLLKRSAIF